MKKKLSPLLGRLLAKLAPKIGARVVLEPVWERVGQIIYKNGCKRYFRGSHLDLNPMGSSETAEDKDYANFFIKSLGYPTIPGKTFYSADWARSIGSNEGIDASWNYAQKIGLPVIVKPNSGSQGVGVALVHTKDEFYRGMNYIFKHDRVALVQTPVLGRDYRVVVLDNEVISAYERIPLNVVGDGKSNILTLLKKKQKDFVKLGRDTVLKLDDMRIKAKLSAQGLSLDSIPIKGKQIFLLDNANLSTGGDSIDVTKKINPAFKKLCIKLTHDMGLRLCGVDLMIDGSIEREPKKYWVIEINSAPGLDHYAASGKEQEKIVEDLYLKVLKQMEKN